MEVELTPVDGGEPVSALFSLAAAEQLERQVARRRRERWGR